MIKLIVKETIKVIFEVKVWLIIIEVTVKVTLK